MQLASCATPQIRLDDANSNLASSYVDPLDPDSDEDLPVVVTRRQLIRLAVVSTEVGARFQRETVDHDSMAWMLAPRTLFDGRDAIDAALEQRHCIRALVLHGLGLGLDARPSDVDDLMSDCAPGRRGRGDQTKRSKRKAAPRSARSQRYASAS